MFVADKSHDWWRIGSQYTALGWRDTHGWEKRGGNCSRIRRKRTL